VHFFFAGLFPEKSSGQAVANLLQYKHTASRFDASIPTKKKRLACPALAGNYSG